MKSVTKVVYSGPFHINTTQALCGSRSQIVSHALSMGNYDVCTAVGAQDKNNDRKVPAEQADKTLL